MQTTIYKTLSGSSMHNTENLHIFAKQGNFICNLVLLNLLS